MEGHGFISFSFRFFFFFSSRRRHTRSYGDWSSDVCSSDLTTLRRRATRPPAQGRGTKSVPRQGHNPPLPLSRSPPGSFKRLLGGAAPALHRASHPPSSAAPPRRRGQLGTSEARVPCSRWRRHPQALRPRQDTRESKHVSEACPVQAAP